MTNEVLDERSYVCEECHNALDLNHIEHNLIESVQKQSMAFQLQDLTCKKCHMVKEDNCSPYCSCSGEYRQTMSNGEFSKKMSTMHKVAKFHKLNRLEEELTWM